nr:uncharacterized protein LOC123745212 [Procambarus clarkii]
MNLLVVDYMGLNNVLPFFSVCGVINCVWLLVFSPLFGLVLDESGSYKVSLGVLGGISFITFVIWLFMPAAVAYDKRNEAPPAESTAAETVAESAGKAPPPAIRPDESSSVALTRESAAAT